MPATQYDNIVHFKNDIIRQLDEVESKNPGKFKLAQVEDWPLHQVKHTLSYGLANEMYNHAREVMPSGGPTNDGIAQSQPQVLGSVIRPTPSSINGIAPRPAISGISPQLSTIPSRTSLASESLTMHGLRIITPYFNPIASHNVAAARSDTIAFIPDAVIDSSHTVVTANTSLSGNASTSQVQDYTLSRSNGKRKALEPPTIIDLTADKKLVLTLSSPAGDIARSVPISRPTPLSPLSKRLQLIAITLPCVHDSMISVHLHGNKIQVCETTSSVQVSGLVKFLYGPEAAQQRNTRKLPRRF